MLLWSSAIIVGILLGLLGAGGSVITVPALIYGAQLPPQQAIVHSLIIVSMISAIAAIRELSKGKVILKSALMFSFASMAGSYLGAQWAADYLTDTQQLAIFVSVMLFAAIAMLRNSFGRPPDIVEPRKSNGIIMITSGWFIGILSATVGVGGGFLIVPALIASLKISIKEAVGTSLIIIFLNSAMGTFGYRHIANPDYHLISIFAGLGILGSFIGSRSRQSLNDVWLKRGFSIFLILLSLAIFIDRFN